MLIKIKDKSTIVLLSILGSILVYSILVNYFAYKTRKDYLYRTATLIDIKLIGRSASNRAIFNYLNYSEINVGRCYFPNDSTEYYKTQIGNRFLVKMNNKQWVNRYFFTYKLYINKPVPDSVEMPINGWKELPEWAK